MALTLDGAALEGQWLTGDQLDCDGTKGKGRGALGLGLGDAMDVVRVITTEEILETQLIGFPERRGK